jgi:hypothetical protein
LCSSNFQAFLIAYSFGVAGFGCVGDPGGAFGSVLGGVGFEDGGGGTSGDEFGTDGDVGGAGVCCVQPTARALNATAARVDLVRFIFTLLSIRVD